MTIKDEIEEILRNDDDAIEASNKIKGIWDANIYYRMVTDKIHDLYMNLEVEVDCTCYKNIIPKCAHENGKRKVKIKDLIEEGG